MFFAPGPFSSRRSTSSGGSGVVVDTTAPTLSAPTDAANGSTGASISVSTNEGSGILYWFISTSSTPPTATNLKAGTGAVVAGNQTVSATGAQMAFPSGLTAGTTYYSHFLHRDASGNESAIVSADGFTTTAAVSGVLLAAEGDSLTAGVQSGAPANSYPALYTPTGGTVTVFNRAVGGSTVVDISGNPDLTERAAADDALIAANPGYSRYVLSVLIGVNDCVTLGQTVASFLTNFAAWLDARRAAGWRIVVITNTPCTSALWNDTQRVTIRNTLATWVGIRIDAIADAYSDSVMGVTGAQNDPTNYDGGHLHFTAAGMGEMARIVKPVWDAACFDNVAPTITSTNAPTVTAGSPFTQPLLANEPVSWAIVGGANAGLFSVTSDPLNGSSISLVSGQAAGSYTVTLRATDRARLTADQTLTLTVTASSVPDKSVVDRSGANIVGRDGSFVITR